MNIRKALATEEVLSYVIAIVILLFVFSFFAIPAVSLYYNQTGGITTFKRTTTLTTTGTTTSTYTTVVTNVTSTRTTTLTTTGTSAQTNTSTNLPMGGNVPDWFMASLAICLIGIPVALLLKFLKVF